MFANPKQRPDRPEGPRPFYEYYAGFSRSFVRDALERIHVDPAATVLDPWNGAGTTTEAGVAACLNVHGYDINPVMVLVAKARLLNNTVTGSIKPICSDILLKAANHTKKLENTENEPLEAWLSPETAAAVRAIEGAIQRLLIDRAEYRPLASLSTFDSVSSLTAFYYTALFKVLRRLLAPLRGSNPTWFRLRSREPRLQVPVGTVHKFFRQEVRLLIASLDPNVAVNQRIAASIDISSSTKLPVSSGTFDAVISSPPYCTRLDYAIATSPELALLGTDAAMLRKLRDSMIGSPTVTAVKVDAAGTWGKTCTHFLDLVRAHPSKASSGYYSKVFLSYFGKMDASFSELARVLKPSAPMVIVAQDSYYKEIHNDLPTILSEMAIIHGFSLSHRDDFVIGNSLRSINSKSRSYYQSCSVTESVLVLRRRPDDATNNGGPSSAGKPDSI
jgi:SAM-dependent methyltransferase